MHIKQPSRIFTFMRISHLIIILIPLLALTISSCTDPEITVTNPEEMEIEEVEEMEADPTADYINLNSDVVYNQDSLYSFYLNLPENSLAFLDNDPTAEEYVEGSITFRGETISPVGIRYKGSIGAYVGCLSGINVFNPNGSKTCTKLSMKIKFNLSEDSEKFYGLKKLQFHSMNNDDSQMRDRLGYHLFNDMGVRAPRCVHAKLYINGEYNGLFALVEQIDGRFSRYHFDGGEGNVYKKVWPIDGDGNALPDSRYLEGLKTNEDDNPDISLMKNFGMEIQNTPSSEMNVVVEKWMDVENTISYCVVDRSIKHDDGPFHWYCNGDDCSNHNYYWYEDPDEEKFYMIPWDMDNSFENWTDFNGVTGIPDEWGEISDNCEPFSASFWGFSQRSAACDKLIGAWADYEDLYESKMAFFKDQYLNEPRIDQLLNTWSAQIEDATQEAFDLHGDAVSISRWQSSMETLRTQLELARNN